MKRTIAVLLCLLSFTGCSLLKGKVDCNEESCITATLEAGGCTDGWRQLPLVVTNEGKTITRYTLAHSGPNTRIAPGGGHGVGVLDYGKSQQHDFLTKIFDAPVIISITQQSPDGKKIIHTEDKKVTVAPC